MPNGEHLRHIFLRNLAQAEGFVTPRGGGRPTAPSRVANRVAHAQSLLTQINRSLTAADAAMQHRENLVAPGENGYYLQVQSRPNEALLADRFERKREGVELLAVKEEGGVTRAELFIPRKAREFLTKTVQDYETKEEPRAKTPEPRNWKLVEGIAEVSPAGLRDLWIDEPDSFPAAGEVIEWEVWFRRNTTERFRQLAAEMGLVVGSYPLIFPEDVALFVEASPEQLGALVEATVSVSRIARAKRPAEFFLSLEGTQQAAYADQLVARLQANPNSEVALCILDTGVRQDHPLLSPVLNAADLHAYDPSWNVDDHHGHGTNVSGLCAYGDLGSALGSGQAVTIPYRLESVKIFPPVGINRHELLGAITAGGIAKTEIANAQRRRVFCLATSTDEDTPHRGQPSSWSAELDQLSSGAGEEGVVRRLICVSAGNVRRNIRGDEYPNINDLSEIESPGQAWNVVTIGAYTQLSAITDDAHRGWIPVAPVGDLCPTSTTASWESTWPVKPDLVLEGGNLAVDPADGIAYGIGDLRLLTTSRGYPTPVFELFGDTSGAAAEAARVAALIRAEYPELWPETVRALMIDSASWTEAMISHLPASPGKSDYAALLKRYGYGVPDVERALWSKRNALTLVAEDVIQPYIKPEKKSARLNEMKVFQVPWPVAALEEMGVEDVAMKVTLSYFVEPNPAESARNRKARYASHGLRFAVKLPDETDIEFRKRVNKAAREEGDIRPSASDTGWVLGPAQRDRGSLHSDIWRGPASDLARRGTIAVYPVGGWWKEREHLERYQKKARFALVVRIETAIAEVDIYTPITNQIAIQV